MRNQIEIKLRNLLNDNIKLNVPIEKLSIEDDLNYLGVNSILYIKLIVAIEDEFDIEFDNDYLAVGSLKNLNMFMDYIESHLNHAYEQ